MKKRLLALFMIAAMLLTILPAGVLADDEVPATSATCGDGLTWAIEDDGTLRISGRGAIPDYSWTENAPWYDSRAAITSVVVEDGITAIGDFAFASCRQLVTAELPVSVVTIGEHAFFNCVALTEAEIPAGVQTIGDYAFYFCISLTEVALGDEVNSIGYEAFGQCSSVVTVSIGKGVETVTDSAFEECTSLESVTLSDSVRTIEACAFTDCPSLNSINIPEGTESIGDGAFYGTTSLQSITLPASVTTIGSGVFEAGGLQHVYFVGTRSQWKAVAIGDDNSVLEAAEVEPLIHEHEWDDGVVTVMPTSKEDGEMLYTCTSCGEQKTEVIPVSGYYDATGTFADVRDSSQYYYKPVYWAAENSITSGITSTLFGPMQSCTRAQAVTFLWRYAGQPTVEGSNPFKDVKESDYFYQAVLWAVSKGITNGTDSTHFSPNTKCTRGQIVTFLWRAAEKPTVTGSNPFKDVKESDYFYQAILWAVAQGITNGTDSTHFSPNAKCTRAQVVTFLWRYAGEPEEPKPCQHNYVDVVTEPTYTEQGYTTHTCSICGDTYIDSYTPVLERPVSETISWNSEWTYADYSMIHDDDVTLYHSQAENANGIVVAVNAGHGTTGGSAVKTYCHPDKTAKVTGGSTAAGSITAAAVSSGTTFLDGTAEAVATLSLAILVKDRLLEAGFDVLMIRENDDTQLDNIARTVYANNNADCHIALHYDSSTTDKGLFYISVPNVESYRSMEPVASHWQEHMALGTAVVAGAKSAGVKIYSSGAIALDLTQTSYSTIPSIDVEVGDRASDYGEDAQSVIADGIVLGIEQYFAD